MGLFQAFGTKLNQARSFATKALGTVGKIGVKAGGLAAMAAPMIAAENPVAGAVLGAVGKIASGIGAGAQIVKTGAMGTGQVAQGINELKALRAPPMVA